MEENIQKAQVGPTNELYLLKGIPLEPTYENTLFFDNVGQQENYFKSKVKYIADNISGMQGNSYWNRLTYIRRSQNTVRIEVNSDKVIDCNYIMFKNTNFTNKWFYGFITETRYINDVTTEIVWELDVMQTWFFDFRLGACFVERMHFPNDPLGVSNHTPEPGNLGEYYTYAKSETTFSNESYIVVATGTVLKEGSSTYNESQNDSESNGAVTYDNISDGDIIQPPITGGNNTPNLDTEKPGTGGNSANATGRFYTGIYSGLAYFAFNSADEVNSYLEEIDKLGKTDTVVSIFMAPKRFFKRGYKGFLDSKQTLEKLKITFSHANFRNRTYGSYVPKNNKLFQYPYCYLRVTNNNGQIQNLWYEDFVGEPTLEFSCATSPTPEIICLPLKYNGESVATEKKVVVKGFPQCAWLSDAYKAYLAQRNSSLEFDAFSSAGAGAVTGAASGALSGAALGSWIPGAGTAVGAGLGALFGGLTGAAGSLWSSVSSAISGQLKHSIEPPISHGTQASGTDFARGITDFSITARGIHQQEARILDDFFTMFGYACNQVITPRINVRPHFTYVKTQGCNLLGSIPGPDAAKIKSIFDNGVTHWRNPSEVGNYAVNNRPVSRETALKMGLEVDEETVYATPQELKERKKIEELANEQEN